MKVLAVVAHPDDEVLGAGATLARLATEGHQVHVLVLAEGVSLRYGRHGLDQARRRCGAAGAVLGAVDVWFGGFASDGRLMADAPSQAVVAVVERTLAAVAPQLVLTHHLGDVHADHRLTHRCVTYATRVLAQGPVCEVLTFEVLSSTEQQLAGSTAFAPDTFVEVEQFVARKCEALEVYNDECFPAPHPRSTYGVRTLAAFRGLQVGLPAAEAFASGRRVLGHRSALPGHRVASN